MKRTKSIQAFAFLCICILVASCERAPQTQTIIDDSGKTHLQAQPFKGASYRTPNGGSSITLISPDELEFRMNNTTFLCKYSKQQDALRVVMTASGTQQVIYFRDIPNGLRSDDGKIFLTPEGMLEFQEQERRAQAAEQDRIARAKGMDEESRRPKKEPEAITWTMPGGKTGTLRLSDTHCTYDQEPIWYGTILEIKVYDSANTVIVYTPSGGNALRIEDIPDKQDFKKIVAELDKAIRAWHEKYPKVNGAAEYMGVEH